MPSHVRRLAAALVLAAGMTAPALSHAQTPVDTGWTYQGRLTDGSTPATGSYDLKFSLFSDAAGTMQVGTTLDRDAVDVAAGLFTVALDFGAEFAGHKRWLQVEVRPAGSGAYTALPLQEVTSAPQSLFSLAPWATDASGNLSFSSGLVGIGRAPEFGLDVSSSTNIRLGLDGNGGGQLVLANNPGDNRLYLEGFDSTGTTSANEMLITGFGAQSLPKLSFRALTASFDHALGVGMTGTPSARLHVRDTNSVSLRIECDGGTNAWSQTEYRNGNGTWVTGTSRNFNGDQYFIYRQGSPTIALAVNTNGLTQVRTLQILGGSDLAEPFNVHPTSASSEQAAPGMVVIIDEANPGDLRIADRPYDRRVAGIISGANGLSPGMVMKAEGVDKADGQHPVAMTGRVWCCVDASFGAVRPGDRLTTSGTPGHAMRASDEAAAGGAVIGKAMTGLPEGRGLVLVLVNLQ